MGTFFLILALLSLLIYLLLGAELALGSRSIRFLRDVPPLPTLLRVSMVVAARNEEGALRKALQSLLSQKYPSLEIIVVNDRSTDRTGAILESMAATEPRLQVVHVTELPPHWLGKNHALQIGAAAAGGELLLFTDADIVMEPTTVARAVHFLESRGLDHLTLAPELRMPSPFLRAFGLTFSFFLALLTRPWRARRPDSSCHIGIGAFNLVRAAAYREAGTHEMIRLRPDDDLKLGKIIKRQGFRQDIVYGAGLVSVEWYPSLRAVIDGLTKNTFSGLEYRLSAVFAAVLFHLVFTLWPFLAVFFLAAPARLVYAAIALLLLLLVADGARFQNLPGRYALAFPPAVAVFLYILLRAAYRNLRDDGIVWRGTHYPLADLKRNKI